MTPAFIAVILLTGLTIGFAKGGFGGLVLVVVPLLTLVMPAQQAVVTILPLLILGDGFTMWAYWRQWDNPQSWLMIPAGVVGAVSGTYLLVQISDGALELTIGIMTLVYIAYRAAAARIETLAYDPPPMMGRVAGFASGITSALANAGAPPYSAYLLLKRLPPVTFMATFTLFFTVINLVKLPLFINTGLLTWPAFLRVSIAAPLIPLGVWLGKRFVKRLDQRTFDLLILGVLFVAGVFLIISGINHL